MYFCNIHPTSDDSMREFRKYLKNSWIRKIYKQIPTGYHTRELLLKSLNYAREYTDIIEEEIEIILACRKSILSDNCRTWVKNHVDNFDVPKGAYDSAQEADLIGIYILDMLGRIVNLDQVGLYHDDGVFKPGR